jgi:hypothetical protein
MYVWHFVKHSKCNITTFHEDVFKIAALTISSFLQLSGTVQRSRVDPRKEYESCGNARAEVMFVTTQRENIRPSKEETNKA